MDPRQTGMDRLLRQSLAAPVPSLPPDFDQRLLRALGQNAQVLGRYRRMLLTGYALVSVVTSAEVMRGQGLGWGAIAGMILGPLAVAAMVPWARRATQPTLRPKAG